MSDSYENLPREKQLRLAVFSEVHKICNEVGTSMDMTFEKDAKCVLSELVWKRLKTYTEDLEQFAKHAKRSTINGEDVKLLARRNPTLKVRIIQLLEEQAKQKKQAVPVDGEAPAPIEIID